MSLIQAYEWNKNDIPTLKRKNTKTPHFWIGVSELQYAEQITGEFVQKGFTLTQAKFMKSDGIGIDSCKIIVRDVMNNDTVKEFYGHIKYNSMGQNLNIDYTKFKFNLMIKLGSNFKLRTCKAKKIVYVFLIFFIFFFFSSTYVLKTIIIRLFILTY